MDSIHELINFTKTLKILVVEDNQDSREQFVGMLSNICDNISSAVDGLDGFEKFKSEKFDLIISDINMPKMSGIEMIESIREIDTEISIIIVSAHNENVYIENTQSLNIEDFLFKPIDLEHFLDVMSKIMDKQR